MLDLGGLSDAQQEMLAGGRRRSKRTLKEPKPLLKALGPKVSQEGRAHQPPSREEGRECGEARVDALCVAGCGHAHAGSHAARRAARRGRPAGCARTGALVESSHV